LQVRHDSQTGRGLETVMQTLPDAREWLSQHVPLTLLLDLLDEQGPDSRRLYREEPADVSWVPDRRPTGG
jgi:hypothetical protein